MINKKDYNYYNKEAISLYEEYKKTVEDINESIKKEAEQIENSVFNLMVLGEAKSGKSTFINAYLGKEILPMDVKQCTSAIIKIKHGKEIKLIAKNANETKKEKDGIEEVREFLKKEAAIDDDYREIPITKINNELLIKNRGRIDDKDIKEFLELEDVKNDNIYNLETNKYNDLIKGYIKNKKDKWGEIITEINITYPLSEEMKYITVIDSPGVGAGGDVGNITEKFLNEANAIIFVKYLKGQALESKSFKGLLDKITEKQKDYLFLVFNGKSDLTGKDFESLEEQAIKLFEKNIDKDKILFVDSKIQLFLNHCLKLHTKEKIDKFFEDLEKDNNNFEVAENCWYKAKDNVDRFKDNMEEKSNFYEVSNAIEKFALTANYKRLKDFLENIEKDYNSKKVHFEEQIEVLKKNFKSPEEFEKAINKKIEEINTTFVKMNDGIILIKRDYSEKLDIESKKIEDDFKKKLERYINIKEWEIKNETFDSLRKETMDTVDEVKKFQDKIAKEVINECDKKLIECSNEISFANIISPIFTKAEFEDIYKEAEKNTKVKGVYHYEEGITFKETKKSPYYHKGRHVTIVANSIGDRFKDIVLSIKDNMVNYINRCIDEYVEKLKKQADRLEDDYKNLLKDKDDNDKKLKQIKIFEEKIKKFEPNIKIINDLKKEIENYVRQ